MTLALQCTSVNNRSVSVLSILHSGFVGGTTRRKCRPGYGHVTEIRLLILTTSLFILPRTVEAMLVIFVSTRRSWSPAAYVCLQQQLKNSFCLRVRVTDPFGFSCWACPSSRSLAPLSQTWVQKRCLFPTRKHAICRGPPSPM